MSTSFDTRLKGFEAKYAHDASVQFKVSARRNKLLGLWVGEHLGKTGDDLSNYAKTVVVADMKEAGDQDVIAKVMADIKAANLSLSQADIMAKLKVYEQEAKLQVADELG